MKQVDIATYCTKQKLYVNHAKAMVSRSMHATQEIFSKIKYFEKHYYTYVIFICLCNYKMYIANR